MRLFTDKQDLMALAKNTDVATKANHRRLPMWSKRSVDKQGFRHPIQDGLEYNPKAPKQLSRGL
jgi:hypothetical protein